LGSLEATSLGESGNALEGVVSEVGRAALVRAAQLARPLARSAPRRARELPLECAIADGIETE